MKKKSTISVITHRDIVPHKDFIRPSSAQTVSSLDSTGTDIFDPAPIQECAPETPQPQPCVQPDPCYYDDFDRPNGSLGTSTSGDVWRDVHGLAAIENGSMLLVDSPALIYHPDSNTFDVISSAVQLPNLSEVGIIPKPCMTSPIQFEVTWWATDYFYATDILRGGTGEGVIVGEGGRSGKYFGAWRQYESAGETCVDGWFDIPTSRLNFQIGAWLDITITMGQYDGYRSPCSSNYSKAGSAYFGVSDIRNGGLGGAEIQPTLFDFVPNQKYRMKVQRENASVGGIDTDGMGRAKIWKENEAEPYWQIIWNGANHGEWSVFATFSHEASTALDAPPVKVYIDDWKFGATCLPAVSTSRLITMTLVQSDQGYYYPPETSVYGYKNVYFDGILGRLGIDYDVSGIYVIPHLSATTYSTVIADIYVNRQVVLA